MSDQGPKAEQRSEEEIVAEIYKNKEHLEYGDEKEFSGCILRYGNKELKVVLARLNNSVSTFIENISKDGIGIPGETTLIVKAANKIIQEWANEVGKPIRHAFTTADEKLKAWAQDPAKGGQVFDLGYIPKEGATGIETSNKPELREIEDKRMNFSVMILPEKK
jgi:hypothetical protein